MLPGLDVTLRSPRTLAAALVQMSPWRAVARAQRCKVQARPASPAPQPSKLCPSRACSCQDEACFSPGGLGKDGVRSGLRAESGSSPRAWWTDPAQACQCLRRRVLSSPFQGVIGNLHSSPEQPGWVSPHGLSSHPVGMSSGSTAHLAPRSPSSARSSGARRTRLKHDVGRGSRTRSASPPAHSLHPPLPPASQATETRGLPQIGDMGSSRACCPRWISRSQGARHAEAACLHSPLPPAFVWAVGSIQGRAPSSSSFQVPRHVPPG